MATNFKGLEVSFSVNGLTYTASLDQDIEIDRTDLNAEFQDQPKRFAWWAMLSELAKDKMSVLKNELDQLYARLDHKVRSEAQAATPPVKLTEKMVENSVLTDGIYQAKMGEYLEARKEHGLLMAGRESFAQRKEMLISLGANYRMESFGDPVVNQEKTRAHASVKVDEMRAREAQKEEARRIARESAEANRQVAGAPTRTPVKNTTRQPVKRT